MKILANAKINLGLNVVSKRTNGYHNLESLFIPISLADEIEITTSQSGHHTLHCTGIDAGCNTADNLVTRAVELVDVPPVEIVLNKRIPTGAGMGGGSSDAAATLKALNKMFALGLSDDEMRAKLCKLGADCPFFVANTAQFAEGIGDKLTPIDVSHWLNGKHIMIVKPNVSVSTKEAYAGIKPRPADIPILFALSTPIENWREDLRNDFEQSVFKLYPEIEAVKRTLYEMGAEYAQMSGSGAAVFGLFNTPPCTHNFPPNYFVWQGNM